MTLFWSVVALLTASTATAGDLIFQDGFESGSTTAWPTVVGLEDRVCFILKHGGTPPQLFTASLDDSDPADRLSPTDGLGVDNTLAIGPGGDQVIFLFFDDNMVCELYLADADLPGVQTKLNGPLVESGSVYNATDSVQYRPNHDQTIYMVSQDAADPVELYLVDLSTPGVTVKLNAPLIGNGNVLGYVVSADGSQLLYQADQDTDTVNELFLVDIDQPGVATKVNPPLVTGGDTWNVGFSPNGVDVVYNADQDVDNRPELYTVSTSAPGTATRLNPPVPAGSFGVVGFDFVPTGGAVVYLRYQAASTSVDLYLVSLSEPEAATQVDAPLVTGGSVARPYNFSPDGASVLYRARLDDADVLELCQTVLANPGVSLRVSGTMVTGGAVTHRFRFTDDAEHVVYIADQDTDAVNELYMVDLLSPGSSVKLNPTLVPGGVVSDLGLYVHGEQVLYQADQDVFNRRRLYVADINDPGAVTQVDGVELSGSRTIGEFLATW